MMDRIRRDRASAGTAAGASSATTDREQAAMDREPAAGEHEPTRVVEREPAEHGREQRFARGGIDRDTMAAARRRQREEYGGIHWGAAFFGFLAAAGLAAILAGLVSAAGATLTLGSDGQVDGSAAETIGIVGAIAMLIVLVVSYFAGGYVAGRMSRFDGARQGLGVFLVALVITLVLAAAGAVLGGEYNVLSQLNLPRIPVDEGSVATGALIALLIGLVGSLLAAMAGGKAGERYHRKIDRLAVDDH
jgi:hypothetical protein